MLPLPPPDPALVAIVTSAHFKQLTRSVLLMLIGFVAPGVKVAPVHGGAPVQVVVKVPPVVAALEIVTLGGSKRSVPCFPFSPLKSGIIPEISRKFGLEISTNPPFICPLAVTVP